MKIEINEEQAKWIRIGLQSYRMQVHVPASFGSMEFLDKENQISQAIDWFDEEVQNAKLWEGNKYFNGEDEARKATEDFENAKEKFQVFWNQLVGRWNDNPAWKALAAQFEAFMDLPATEVPIKAAEPVEDAPEAQCGVCGQPLRWLESVNGEKVWIHRGQAPKDRHSPKPVHDTMSGWADGKLRTMEQMTADLTQICMLIEEYRNGDRSAIGLAIDDLLVDKGYME